MNTNKDFERWKENALSKVDFSRKGSVDEKIKDLILWLNSQEGYFTTSSCSGRIVVCSDDDFATGESFKYHKKTCKWYIVSHNELDAETTQQTINNDVDGASKLKFEQFILHVQCATLQCAKLVHQAAVESGFRNSGITFGKNNKKIIVAVRGTACLEVPLTNDKGILMVPDTYVKTIVEIANKKLNENFLRIEQFYSNLKFALSQDEIVEKKSDSTGKVKKQSGEIYRKKNKQGRTKLKSNGDALEDIFEVGFSDIFADHSS